MQLPPIGQITDENMGDVVTHLGNIVQESNEARSPMDVIVNDCLAVYAQGDIDEPDEDEIVVFEAQNAVIVSTDIQSKEPPSVTLEPVETGEPPQYYWAGPPQVGAMLGLEMHEVADWQDPSEPDPETGQPIIRPPSPLDPMVAEALTARALTKEQAPVLPPGAIRPEWIIAQDDQLVADVMQTVFDVLWKRSRTDRYIRKNLFFTNVAGWAFGLYEWDDGNKKHLFKNLPLKQVHFDPTVDDISEAAYVGFDLPMDADEAKAHYPELAEMIDGQKTEGIPSPLSETFGGWSSVYQRNFRRDMVVFRVFWLRNQPKPLTPDEAKSLNAVHEQPDPMDPTGQTMRLHSAKTGQPVQEGDPGWPQRFCIRQITQLGSVIVDDRECEFADIPILHNQNIPLPITSPFAFGEPHRIKNLGRAESWLLDSMVTHAGFFANPMVCISESAYMAIPEEMRDAPVHPGMRTVLPDAVMLATGGKPMVIQDPPQTPPALVNLYPIIENKIAEQSGNTPTLRGQAPSANASGKMVEMLQTAGMSQMGFKAARTSDMVEWLANLMTHSIVWRMTCHDIYQIVSKYPYHVLEAICNRAQQLEWNMTVNVEAGNGTMKQQKAQTAAVQHGAGLISKQTAQEKSGIDPRVEDQRQDTEFQKQVRQQQQMMPPPQQSTNGSNQQ